MIARLLVTEMTRAWRLWIATFLVMVAAALIALVCAGDVSTAAAVADPVQARGLRNHALVFGGINSLVVIGALTVLVSFAIRIQRRNYALWQFAGIGPALVRRIVLAQVSVLALLAFGVALALSPVVLAAVLDVLSAPLRDIGAPSLDPRLDVLEALVAFLVFMAVAVGSAITAARAASRVPALLVVRDPEDEPRRLGRARVVAAWAFAITSVVLFGMLLADLRVGPEQLFLVVVAGCVIAIAPWSTPALLELWSGLVPGRGTSWWLARQTALHHAARSHAAVTLLAVASILGSLTGYAGVWENATTLRAGLAIFGTPIAVVLFTGAATVVMTTPGRRRDTALLVIAGGTFRSGIGMAFLEAIIVAVTAGIIAVVPALAVVPVALGAWYDPLLPLPFVVVFGFVIMSVATVRPVLQARRRSLGAQLVEGA